MVRANGPKRRRLGYRLIYLIVVAAGAVALWLFIPEEVKRTIWDTYVNPP